MRQPSITLLLIFFICANLLQSGFATIKGGIDYSLPVNYENLSESELEFRAKFYYHNATKLEDGKVNEDMTNALMLYSVLQRVNPEKTEYPIKLGILYDKLGKDRIAKANFSKAIGLNSLNPETYFCLGEFYYKRTLYRRALKYYNKAYTLGYDKNYDLLWKVGDIYEKFGDTRSSLKYLKEAFSQSPNPELENKIKRVEVNDSINPEFYSDTRIRG